MTVLLPSCDAIVGPLSDGKIHAFGGGRACAGLGREQPDPHTGGAPTGWISALLILVSAGGRDAASSRPTSPSSPTTFNGAMAFQLWRQVDADVCVALFGALSVDL